MQFMQKFENHQLIDCAIRGTIVIFYEESES